MDEIEIGKTKIEWATKSVSPIVGCNGPKGVRCEFCFAWRIALRLGEYWGYPQPDPFVPSFHPDRLNQIKKRRKPTVWFFGSMCDHLDDGVKPEWRERCYKVMRDSPQHIFVTLTKQYSNLWKVEYDSPGGLIPPNVIVGVSVCYRSQIWGLNELVKVDAPCRLACFEPMKEDLKCASLEGIDWVIIGAQSRQAGIGDLPTIPYFRPDKAWVQGIVAKARKLGIPIFLKPNLGDYVSLGWFEEKIEETPFEKMMKK